MKATGIEFAPGTTDDSKRLVAKLFKPGEILGAYRQARGVFHTGDLVLVVSESNPTGFNVEPRMEYLKRLRQVLGVHAAKMMPTLGLASSSAHKVMKLPMDSEAMWLIVTRGQDLPVMCVLFTTPYETGDSVSN